MNFDRIGRRSSSCCCRACCCNTQAGEELSQRRKSKSVSQLSQQDNRPSWSAKVWFPQNKVQKPCGAREGAKVTISSRGRSGLRNWFHLGELSAGRQALEGAEVAPGTLRTVAALTDPDKRPALPREPLPEDIDAFVPTSLFDLDWDRFCSNVRTARRGAAGGPSGMTADHLRPLLDNDHDIASVCRFAQIMAWGEVPDLIEPAVRLGRITALQKPDGGVRGNVV